VLPTRVMAEVDDQPDFEAGGAPIVQDLGAVLIGPGADRLDSDDLSVYSEYSVVHSVSPIWLP
jgi:hypothetical protein